MKRRFSAVRTEGGLLPQDVLTRLQAGDKDLDGTKPKTYHLGPHERIGEEVNRAWSKLTSAWRNFQEALEKEPEKSLATGLTRDRWLLPLFSELGYGRLPKGSAIDVEGKSFAISHVWHHSPIHLLGARVDLDRRQKGVAGAAASSPHGLVQEFLNRSDDHLWGFVSNGYKLRVLRDHHSLTRQAYVEFDLQSIMEGEQYSEFLLLWLVCHQSRVETEKPEECWLEKWFNASKEEGVRALDKLRVGVEKAIEAFGSGFLAHKANDRLRQALESGELDKQEYYRQVLRLVYRLIFIFVAEEREALLDPNADEAAKERYLKHYAARRIRELAEKRRGSPHGDLWQALRLVMSKLNLGCPDLALPALGSLLWGDTACPWLMEAECSNEHLLTSVRRLSQIQEGKTIYPVNWRNVGAEELGSIYESLLELHPRINKEAGTFELDTAAGHERKTTGSYYTPSSLVNCLLDSALDPVLDEAVKKPDPEKAILDLKVCDPASGSGHFLVAAARRMARRLASVRSGDDEPSPRDVDRALRDVVGRCIYGVDINPMAVELCKVSLWMEAIEPGKPLSFLDHHIKCGNSLLGSTPALLREGIPDAAFTPITGDDKKVCAKWKKLNKEERKSGQTSLFDSTGKPWERLGDFARSMLEIDDVDDGDISGVLEKQRRYESLVKDNKYLYGKLWADSWCAAFVMKKDKENESVITEETFRRIEANPFSILPVLREEIQQLSSQYQFFHWHLEFPDVFSVPSAKRKPENEQCGWSGGFNCVLGNPPWEKISIREKEWFSEREPKIANAKTAAERKKLIAGLKQHSGNLYAEFEISRRLADGQKSFLKNSGRYPLCGVGDINTFAVFAENNTATISSNGSVGCILPSGIATDNTTKEFFSSLVASHQITCLYSFENEEFIFPAVHHATRFCLLTVNGIKRKVNSSQFAFYLRQVKQLASPSRTYFMTPDDFNLLNPNTQTCPTFRTNSDAEITKSIYRNFPVLENELTGANPWKVDMCRMLHMSDDSGLFLEKEDLFERGGIQEGSMFVIDQDTFYPIYEAKMIWHFDHRFGTFENQTQAQANQGKLPELSEEDHSNPNKLIEPRYWISEKQLLSKFGDLNPYNIVVRLITGATVARTFIPMLIPNVPTGNSVFAFNSKLSAKLQACLLASLSSFCFDYVTRQKVGGVNMSYFYVRQFPVIPPEYYRNTCFQGDRTTIDNWILPRALELIYSAWDHRLFASDCKYDGPPFRWDDERRFTLRCELDALFFHLYRISRHDVDYILETFPIIKKREVKTHSKFITKETILEIYDAMAEAMETGHPYQTSLNPPPGPPVDENGDFIPMEQWDKNIWPKHIHPPREEAEELRPAAQAQPIPIEELQDGCWARPRTDHQGETGAMLAAILKSLDGPIPTRDIRLAEILALEPHLLLSLLNEDEATTWKRLVGNEADTPTANVSQLVPQIDTAWGQAVRQYRATGALIEDLESNTWAKGNGLESINTEGWPDGRARMVLDVLSRYRADDVISQLPKTIRGWVIGKAA